MQPHSQTASRVVRERAVGRLGLPVLIRPQVLLLTVALAVALLSLTSNRMRRRRTSTRRTCDPAEAHVAAGTGLVARDLEVNR